MQAGRGSAMRSPGLFNPGRKRDSVLNLEGHRKCDPDRYPLVTVQCRRELGSLAHDPLGGGIELRIARALLDSYVTDLPVLSDEHPDHHRPADTRVLEGGRIGP